MTAIPVDSPAVAHGLGLFETMLVVGGRAAQLDAHWMRLQASCGAIGFPPPDSDRFHAAVDEAVDSCGTEEAALRCLYVAHEAHWREPAAWTLAATAGPVPRLTLERRAGARAITLDASFTRSLPAHKLTSYAVCRLGLALAVEKGANEAFFLNRENAVLEGTATNVFATAGDRLVTAPVQAGILPGIVRASVLDAAARLRVDVEERTPTRAELLRGAFVTSSLTLLAPLETLDGAGCDPPGDVFNRLSDLVRRELREGRVRN